MSLAKLVSAWNDFFFKPVSPLPYAVFRILYGFVILQLLFIQLLPDFELWYGEKAIISVDAVTKYFWHHPIFDFLALTGNNAAGLQVFFAVTAISAFCLMIGFGTRYSALMLFMCLISMHQHDPMNINGGDCFIRLAAFFLIFSHAGELLSVDRWIKKKYHPEQLKDEYWPWAQRLFQIQFVIVYWQTSVVKLSGTQWIDGTALYYATRLEDMFRFPIPFIYDNLWTCQILTWAALGIEVALWTLIWIKEFRYYVLALGVLLHIGIDLSLSLPLFETAFIYSYVVWVEPDDLRRAFYWSKDFVMGGWRTALRKENASSSDTVPDAVPVVTSEPAPADAADGQPVFDCNADGPSAPLGTTF